MKGSAAAGDAIDDFLAQAGDHLMAVAVIEAQQEDDEAAGREAAERAVSLDEHRLAPTGPGVGPTPGVPPAAPSTKRLTAALAAGRRDGSSGAWRAQSVDENAV